MLTASHTLCMTNRLFVGSASLSTGTNEGFVYSHSALCGRWCWVRFGLFLFCWFVSLICKLMDSLAVLIAGATSRIFPKHTCPGVCWELQLCLKWRARPSDSAENNYSTQPLPGCWGSWKILIFTSAKINRFYCALWFPCLEISITGGPLALCPGLGLSQSPHVHSHCMGIAQNCRSHRNTPQSLALKFNTHAREFWLLSLFCL